MAIGPSDILSVLQNGVTAVYDLTATVNSNSSGLIVSINSNSSALVTAISCGFAEIFT